jgi:membrane associated rhomboid family serine protease
MLGFDLIIRVVATCGILGGIIGFIVGLLLAHVVFPHNADASNSVSWTVAVVGASAGLALARRFRTRNTKRS